MWGRQWDAGVHNTLVYLDVIAIQGNSGSGGDVDQAHMALLTLPAVLTSAHPFYRLED